MKHFSHYCPSCCGSIFYGECTGESGIYRSWNIPDLCDRCWLIEDAIIDKRGTNDLPEILAVYIDNNRQLNL